MPKFSINLVTWNGEKYISHCINSVLNQTYKDYELNIFDNASNDNTVNILNKNFPELKVIANKENLGFSKAHNKLISWAKGEYILCLNQDVILESNFLENAARFLEMKNTNGEIGSISPKIFKWEFDDGDPYKANQKGKTNIIDSCGLKIFKNHRVVDIGQGESDSDNYNKLTEIFGVSGACPIYSKYALENIKIGNEYFDEDFFMYKEDVDLAFRLRLAGYKSFFVPSLVAYHDRTIHKNQTRKSKSSWINKYSYKNHIAMLLKNVLFGDFVRCFFELSFYELKKFLYIMFYEKETFKFFMTNLHLKKNLKKRIFVLKNICKIKSRDLSKWYSN